MHAPLHAGNDVYIIMPAHNMCGARAKRRVGSGGETIYYARTRAWWGLGTRLKPRTELVSCPDPCVVGCGNETSTG